jgi:hypothetical protein
VRPGSLLYSARPLFFGARSVHVFADLSPNLRSAVSLRMLRTAIHTSSVVTMLLAVRV